jgi:hypothetical protein
MWFADRQHGGVVAVPLAAMTVGLALRANPRAPVAHTITLVRASARVNDVAVDWRLLLLMTGGAGKRRVDHHLDLASRYGPGLS